MSDRFKQHIAQARVKNARMKGYFDDDDDDDGDNGQPLPTSSSSALAVDNNNDDDDDPLEAFMANVQAQVTKEAATIGLNDARPEIVSSVDEYADYNDKGSKDINGGDEVGVGASIGIGDDDAGYDSDGLPINGRKDGEKSRVEPLPPVDHNAIHYRPFRRNFYVVHPTVAAMDESAVDLLREGLEVSVLGDDVPRPIETFDQSSLPPLLLKEVTKLGYEKPTSIQAQALPIALSGRDMIGLAKTGSGKTLAFLFPMITHILDQPQMQVGDGPIGLVLSPTRELASQIYVEAKKFAKLFNMRVCAVFGGAGKWEMTKALKEAPEIVVATPGRLIGLIRNKSTNLQRCTIVVLDEADRMFEMGFEYQMRSIINNVRPDRQTLLFSATMKRKVEGFAREILTDPVRVVVGTIGQANPDIRQVVEFVPNADAKWPWLAARADEYVAEGKVLIFVLSKVGTEELAAALRQHFARRQLDVGVECLHGDKDQGARTAAMRAFKSGVEASILVATDIASRGLDVKDVRTVVNYDVAKNIETYVHRIGRTGRMGLDGVVPGTAYTLVTPADGAFAVDLVHNLRLSGQPVPPALLGLAEKDPKWSRARGGGGNFGGGGRGRGSGAVGLGAAGAPRAMTSAMMAAASSSSSSS